MKSLRCLGENFLFLDLSRFIEKVKGNEKWQQKAKAKY